MYASWVCKLMGQSEKDGEHKNPELYEPVGRPHTAQAAPKGDFCDVAME